MGRAKDSSKSTQSGGHNDEQSDQENEDHDILHHGDHGWRAQATGIGVRREDEESDQQRQVNVEAAD